MSSLIANLHRGAAALSAQSKGLEVAGRNMANVNTPGYSRQILQLSAGETLQGRYGPEAMAVRVDGVTQARDTFLDRQITAEKSLSANIAARREIYSRTQDALGQGLDTSSGASSVDGVSAGSGGINGALSEFFDSVQALAANPSDAATKTTVIEQAGILADLINEADRQLAAVQGEATEKIEGDLVAANGLLKSVADLNAQIARYEVGNPGSALDLRDQRQSKLEELAGYMNFETRPDPSGNGQVQVFARDGGGGEVPLVTGNIPRTVTFTGTSFEAGTPPATLDLTGGSMPSQLAARDGFVQGVRDDLAAFSGQLRDAVNAAYSPSGQQFFAAGTGGNLIQVAPGLTASTLTATTTGDSGANELANALAAVADQRFSVSGGDSIDGTLGGYFTKTVARVGSAVNSATGALEDQQLTEQLALSRRDQVSGVSLDEEATNLMKYQRAFQASARFVNVVDDLLDTIVNRLGKL